MQIPYLAAEIEEKTERLVKLLRSEKLGGVLLNGQHNFAWLTGGARNGIDLSRENGAANLLVTAEGRRYIFANCIEMPRMLAEEVSSDIFEPVEYSWQDEKTSPESILKKAAGLTEGDIAADIRLWPKTRTIEGLIAKCRFSLTAAEIVRIRDLGKDAAEALDRTVSNLVLGDTEAEIARRVQTELAAFDITSVVTLVAADERISYFRHPVPTDNRWRKLLLLVTCAKRRGLIVSLSRMICSGAIPVDLQHKTEAAAFVNAALWHASRPGVTGAELYQAAADAYAVRGFAREIDCHHQGGAAGYKTREWVAHPESKDVVQENQAFAWNPSITGTKIEETILIGKGEVEIITASKIFPQISTEIDRITYLSPGILSV